MSRRCVTVVNWLTAPPPAGISNRTVIEYETEGTAVTDLILSRPKAAARASAGGRGRCRAVLSNPRPSGNRAATFGYHIEHTDTAGPAVYQDLHTMLPWIVGPSCVLGEGDRLL
jgi:hypothetical protein